MERRPLSLLEIMFIEVICVVCHFSDLRGHFGVFLERRTLIVKVLGQIFALAVFEDFALQVFRHHTLQLLLHQFLVFHQCK